jgi:hypothetical protein
MKTSFTRIAAFGAALILLGSAAAATANPSHSSEERTRPGLAISSEPWGTTTAGAEDPLPDDELGRDAGGDPHLRRDHPVAAGAGPAGPQRERRTRL